MEKVEFKKINFSFDKLWLIGVEKAVANVQILGKMIVEVRT
jgi:hypothetical protein